ncbi:CRISPR-associated protein Cas4 [Peptostreptococcaceae bacterium OttesenSCG-928-C18]|nr:CRISPR-associated protein Cas4 [Peptostreptococcaceae bacterium OttesenSCG-928-C18]
MIEKPITGMMVNYFHVCKRKLWYFYYEIQMEHGNENVAIGKILDETSYKREDKHINIDNIINIDFLKAEGILHEVKKSNKIEEAAIWQVKYYLYYLKQYGVNIKAKIDYPLLKKSLEVELEEHDCEVIENILKEIKKITAMNNPPELEKLGICKKCSYFDLCFI